MSDDDDHKWRVERLGPGSSDESAKQARIAWYRRHAADLRAKAENMKGMTARRHLLEVVRQYENLATSIERLLSSRRGD